jgi:hypothetical protein
MIGPLAESKANGKCANGVYCQMMQRATAKIGSADPGFLTMISPPRRIALRVKVARGQHSYLFLRCCPWCGEELP